jgi:hypothetical protein
MSHPTRHHQGSQPAKRLLLFAEELTLHKKISDETFAEAQKVLYRTGTGRNRMGRHT